MSYDILCSINRVDEVMPIMEHRTLIRNAIPTLPISLRSPSCHTQYKLDSKTGNRIHCAVAMACIPQMFIIVQLSRSSSVRWTTQSNPSKRAYLEVTFVGICQSAAIRRLPAPGFLSHVAYRTKNM